MNLNMIIILSNIFSSSSSVASLFPARSFESTYFAEEHKISSLVNINLQALNQIKTLNSYVSIYLLLCAFLDIVKKMLDGNTKTHKF